MSSKLKGLTASMCTYSELSRLTGRHEGTLRQWRNRGKLPAPDQYIGKSPVWSLERMADWIDANKVW